jgi:hypothetical protein
VDPEKLAGEFDMALYAEGRDITVEGEPFGLLTEGAAGIVAIVLGILALAGVSATALASITTIVIGVGLMVQAFNAAAETSKVLQASGTAATVAARTEIGGEVIVDIGAGLTGIVLGILALIGINPQYLIPAALIVFGGSLLLSGAVAAQSGPSIAAKSSSGAHNQISHQNSATISGFELLIGFVAVILGILSLIVASSGVLVLVGFIAVGAALLVVSASFSGAVMRLFTTTDQGSLTRNPASLP